MSMMWVGIGSLALGTGASLYGASRQAGAVRDANAQNAELQREQNQSAWNAYLLSRGINPGGAATGEIPSNPQPVNSRLPLWANVERSPQARQGFRIGTGARSNVRLAAPGRAMDGVGIGPAMAGGGNANNLLPGGNIDQGRNWWDSAPLDY